MNRRANHMRTSETHPLYISEVTVPGASGRIGITFCPGKKGESFTGPDWDRDLHADLDQITRWGARKIITLLEDHEFEMLGVPGLGDAIKARGLEWIHMPIQDGAAPEARSDAEWEGIRLRFADTLRQGESILVHCRGGLGRAGTVAALLLMDQGIGWQEAMALVRSVRPGAVETNEQEKYIADYAPLLPTQL